jgi:SAM-dependent methyltransferase
MPVPCGRALDAGCGEGPLTPKLAERARHVIGIDKSAEMIAIARQNAARDNITYLAGDLMTYPLPYEDFDFIAAVAVIHHMPFESVMQRLMALLRHGGVLAIVGLAINHSPVDHAFSAVSVPVSRIARLRRGWWNTSAREIDPDMTFAEIRSGARALLPGTEVKRRLYFRYTLVWKKP